MFLAYLYLENSDKLKYGLMVKHLSTQFLHKQDQYPKTITDANNVLSNHRYDQAYHDAKKNRKSSQNQSSNNSNATAGQPKAEVEIQYAQIEGKCFCCGKAGHKSPDCRLKTTIPREKWYVHRAKELKKVNEEQHQLAQYKANEAARSAASQQNVQNEANQPAERVENPVAASQVVTQAEEQIPNGVMTWMGHQICAAQTRENMKEWILLDSQSSIDLFCNPRMVTDIYYADTLLQLETNGGTLIVEKKVTVPKYGSVWFSEKAMTNVFSLANMTKKHRVKFDSEIENAFIVHTPEKQIRFTHVAENLYVLKMSNAKGSTPISLLMETVNENKSFHTAREIQRAKEARKLMVALAYPTVRD